MKKYIYLLCLFIFCSKNKNHHFSYIDVSCLSFAYEFYINIDSLGYSKLLVKYQKENFYIEFKIKDKELDTLNFLVDSVLNYIKDTSNLNKNDNKIQYDDCDTYNLIIKNIFLKHKFYVFNNCLENKILLNNLNKLISRIKLNIDKRIDFEFKESNFESFDKNVILSHPPPPPQELKLNNEK